MKKYLKIVLPVMLLAMSSCTQRTEYGSCVGIADTGNPKLQYKLSGLNTALAIVFFETIFVPVIYLADDAKCPVGPKYVEN